LVKAQVGDPPCTQSGGRRECIANDAILNKRDTPLMESKPKAISDRISNHCVRVIIAAESGPRNCVDHLVSDQVNQSTILVIDPQLARTRFNDVVNDSRRDGAPRNEPALVVDGYAGHG
jgi:hypothetical protein